MLYITMSAINFPPDILNCVMSYAEKTTEETCTRVSKKWRDAALCNRVFGNVALPLEALARYGVSAIRPKGVCLHTLVGHRGIVSSVTTLGGQVVSVSWDSTLKIWDPKTGACLQTLKGHMGAVSSITTLGGQVVSASEDAALNIWDPSPSQEEMLQYVIKGILPREALPAAIRSKRDLKAYLMKMIADHTQTVLDMLSATGRLGLVSQYLADRREQIRKLLPSEII